ncbi:PH domain-containing protein [Lihuaxuella thermophila]|uniref:YvbH-like oligomerisation region n=1 Tax=Lihuaxuella thermophila TaxID=1173111 RepID=A0A1H8CX09_9BACL|nr:PH domain-containing protein [Lihuaxuella thermophila]SEM98868.1 YvbH-like oligomerisation region [Lihuaxuella thermophila]
MFGKVASDVLGLSDVGSVIKPENYDKVDADDYVMHEDGEKIFFLIKSKSDEYCFTNKALIHLDGTSATSKKRTLRRFNYSTHRISSVTLETAGTVDLDIELKFKIGSELYSIDVHKKHLEELKDLYKALLKIEEISRENEIILEYAKQSLNLASTTLSSLRNTDNNLVEQFKELNQVAFSWLVDARKQYHVKDFGFVFERYINN